MSTITLSPAYGRDYKNQAEVKKDFKEGKDFIIEDVRNPWCGKPCSIRDLKGQYAQAQVYYAKKRKTMMIAI